MDSRRESSTVRVLQQRQSDGSIALFVTHERGPGDADWVATPDVADAHWGRLITLVPAAEVTAIYLRHPRLT